MKKNYKLTVYSCFIGYIVLAIVNNFVPLLFVTLQSEYNISLSQITLLVTINFGIQLLSDLAGARFIDRIGYRASILIAHATAAAGLILLTVLPNIMPPFAGILISVVIYAIGGGIIEVLISPIMEGCPSDSKEKAMSLLHSFYCWGYVGVIALSTLFFFVFGVENWRWLALIWAAVPIVNGVLFVKAPINHLIAEGEQGMSIRQLLKSRAFLLLVVIALCAGSAGESIGQWMSAFAEQGLGISKTVGDLAGPTVFAALMGISRAAYGKFGDKINLDKYMTICGVLCVASYLLASLAPLPIINLIGCALCGLFVGIMWPGTFSKAAQTLPLGGTAMFALLALAGDLGATAGPTLVGMVSDAAGSNLKLGILVAAVFPALLAVCLMTARKKQN